MHRTEVGNALKKYQDWLADTRLHKTYLNDTMGDDKFKCLMS